MIRVRRLSHSFATVNLKKEKTKKKKKNKKKKPLLSFKLGNNMERSYDFTRFP